MSGFQALALGLRVTRRSLGLVVAAWGADLLVAAAVAVPLVAALDRVLGGQGDGGAIGAVPDGRLLAAFVARYGGPDGATMGRLLAATLAAVLVHAVVSGGLLSVLGRGAPAEGRAGRWRRFLAGCAAHAGRMVTISVVILTLLAATGWLLDGVLADALEAPLRDVGREPTRLLLRLLPGVVAVVAIMLGSLVADVWRAAVVVGGVRLGPGLRLCGRVLRQRPGGFVVVGAGGLALMLAGLAGFTLLDGLLPQGRWPGILLALALGQALMLWRHGVRVGVIAAEARLVGAALEEAAGGQARAAGPVGDASPP